MDMDPPHHSHTKPIMSYSLMHMLGMTKLRGLTQEREEMYTIAL